MSDVSRQESTPQGTVMAGESHMEAGSEPGCTPEAGAEIPTTDHSSDGLPACVLPTIRRLFDELEARGIRYCHWKSNIRLAAVLAGREDLDILVDRRDAARIHTVLPELGFKWMRSYAGLDHPGVVHALALEDTTGQLVHLHAYYGIVSGDSLVKSYRLPVEQALLDQTGTLLGVRIPAAATELVLFVLRILLKHVSPVEIYKVNQHYRDVVAELAWLRAAAVADQVESVLARYFPMIKPALFHQLIEAVADQRAWWRRAVLGGRVAWRLRDRRRLGPVHAVMSRTWRLGALALGRVGRRRDLVPLTGGAIVALVGPKATGKSTLARELERRLGRHLRVVRIHAGKPPRPCCPACPPCSSPSSELSCPRSERANTRSPSGEAPGDTRCSTSCA